MDASQGNKKRPRDEHANADVVGSVAQKPKPSLSLDAIAKAKKALQMQKELKEKLLNLPHWQLSSQIPSAAPAATPSLTVPPTTTLTAAAAAVPSVPLAPATAAVDMSAILKAQEFARSLGFQMPPDPLLSATAAASAAGARPSLLPAGTAGTAAVPSAAAAALPLVLGAGQTLLPAGQTSVGAVPFGAAGTAAGTTAGGSVSGKSTRAPVLRLDAMGREIDEEGRVVERPKAGPVSSLKVNINKAKKEAFKILRPELEPDDEASPFFDPRMRSERVKLARPKRSAFQFVEEGTFARQAEAMRLRASFGAAQALDMKARQQGLMRQTFVTSSVAADVAGGEENPNLIAVGERAVPEEKEEEPIPAVEWWDALLLADGCKYPESEDFPDSFLKAGKITHYVEHPVPIEPPAEAPPPPPQPLRLTKKEQKKLRTQRRVAREKEKQEMVRQGLMPAPEPKVKLSNLHRVLASEAVQDPTKMEREVRVAQAEREAAHVDRNMARKLTPAEKREKKERKLFEDGVLGPGGGETVVAVFKVGSLAHPQTRFKVDVNAQENRLTGCALLTDSFCLVLVEGCSKSIKRYSKLMLNRIKWPEAVVRNDADDEAMGEEEATNYCQLVWQGAVAKPVFEHFTIEQCHNGNGARKFLGGHTVPHYWDLAENLPGEA